MGYTIFSKEKVTKLLASNPHTIVVIDIGAQQDYGQPNLPAPYMSEWYKRLGKIYTAIDISGENNSLPWDLGTPFEGHEDPWNRLTYPADLLVDCGTQEHIGRYGHFDLEAIYQCMRTKHILLKVGGYMFNENPKTGNWPGHGLNYFSKKFYWQLIAHSDYELIECDEVAAMGNAKDGWNVYAIMKKTGSRFPTLDEFKTFDLHTF